MIIKNQKSKIKDKSCLLDQLFYISNKATTKIKDIKSTFTGPVFLLANIKSGYAGPVFLFIKSKMKSTKIKNKNHR